jgi:hypothetical protein
VSEGTTAAWYHGSPLRLNVLCEGSTITQDRRLAEVFSHKPTIVSVDDENVIVHDGTRAGFLYRVAETLGAGDVYPHPTSSMAPGKEWLTRRALRLEMVGPVAFIDGERLSEKALAMLRERAQQRAGG